MAFAKNENELETLTQTIRICNQDIGMEFGIEKCNELMMKKEKRAGTKRIEQQNEERIKTFGKKRFGNIGSRHHKTSGDERKSQKRVS